MSLYDPYQCYAEGSVFSANPVHLVVALYEGVIESIREAQHCLTEKDVLRRGKAIIKANRIIFELIASLDHEKGRELSRQLLDLYVYIQRRLIEAHARQAAEPLTEAEAVFSTLLEGWRTVACEADKADRATRAEVDSVSIDSECSDDYSWCPADLESSGMRLSVSF